MVRAGHRRGAAQPFGEAGTHRETERGVTSALGMGLNGRLFFSLNASPEGSTPIFLNTSSRR